MLQGYGASASKSSAKPKLVEPLSDIYVHTAAGGHAHVILLARVDGDAEKAAIGKLPEFVCPK